jgi:sec-independent protein translocase protein TatA
MGGLSIWHWMIVLVIILLLFGRGKISDIMGDVAKGVKSFKRGMADDEGATAATASAAAPRPIADAPADVVVTATRTDDRSPAAH